MEKVIRNLSHKLNSFEAQLEIISMLQVMNLKIHYIYRA